MIRLTFKIISLISAAAAFAALVVDGTRSLASSQISLVPFGEAFEHVFPHRLEVLQAQIERDLHPLIWDPLVLFLLQSPSWLILALMSYLFMRLSRQPKGPIGFSSRS
jgi:hypothetical protein